MKTVLIPVLLTACLVAGALPTTASDENAGSIFPYKTSVTVLDNGLKVILIPMQSQGLVAFWHIVRTGSRDEYEPGRTGFAHFFEHMMFRGTEKYPAEKYNGKLIEMGADSNAFTTDDLTAYHMDIVAEDLPLAMDLESDRFQNLSYPEEAFKTEAGAVYGEYRKNKANPFFSIYEGIQGAAFKSHTYGHTTMGYEADIKAMPTLYQYSKEFFSRYYRPDNIVILIAGDIEIDPTLAMIRAQYGEWEEGYVTPEIVSEPEQTSERTLTVTYPGRTLPILWIAYKMPAFDPSDRSVLALDLLGELAFGETSDLYRRLVLEEQVVEFVSGTGSVNRDPSLFNILSRIKDPEKVDYVQEQIEAALKHYQENLPDPKRLTDLKSRLKYDFLMGLDTPAGVAGALSRIIAVTGGIQAVDTMIATYGEITAEDIQAAALSSFHTEKRTVGVLRGKN